MLLSSNTSAPHVLCGETPQMYSLKKKKPLLKAAFSQVCYCFYLFSIGLAGSPSSTGSARPNRPANTPR